MYLMGLATFTFASFLCGLAPNAWTVVGLRVLQAAGAAMLLTNSAALVTAAFPRARLGQGMGIYLASFSVAQLLGPTVGGVLAEHAGWRWVFWFNVPVGLICLAWGAWALPRVERSGQRQGIDVPGNLLVIIALGSGLAALSQATTLGWTSWVVIGGLVVFLLGMPAFVLFERRVMHPLVDMTLFRDRPFALGLGASFLNSTSQAGVLLLFSLYFQAVQGVDPLSAGLRVLPLAVATLVFSSSSGLFQRWISPRALAVIGNLCTGAGLSVLAFSVITEAGYVAIAAGLVLAGAGSGLFMPSNTTALMGVHAARPAGHRQRDAADAPAERVRRRHRRRPVRAHRPARPRAPAVRVRRHAVRRVQRRPRRPPDRLPPDAVHHAGAQRGDRADLAGRVAREPAGRGSGHDAGRSVNRRMIARALSVTASAWSCVSHPMI